MACLVVTVQAAGTVTNVWEECPDTSTSERCRSRLSGRPLVLPDQHGHGRTAIALSTRQSVMKVWNENFLWSAPSYLSARVPQRWASGIELRFGALAASVGAAPLYLTYRSYKVYLGRIDDEQRHVREMADLHLATIEALALAIEPRIRRRSRIFVACRCMQRRSRARLGMSENDIQGVKTAALLHDIGKLAVPEHILSKRAR